MANRISDKERGTEKKGIADRGVSQGGDTLSTASLPATLENQVATKQNDLQPRTNTVGEYKLRFLRPGEWDSIVGLREEYRWLTLFVPGTQGIEVEQFERIIFYLAMLGVLNADEYLELAGSTILGSIVELFVDGFLEALPISTLVKLADKLTKAKDVLERLEEKRQELSRVITITPKILLSVGELREIDILWRTENILFDQVAEERYSRVDTDEIIMTKEIRHRITDEVKKKLAQKGKG